jgi:hypothetical protein
MQYSSSGICTCVVVVAYKGLTSLDLLDELTVVVVHVCPLFEFASQAIH